MIKIKIFRDYQDLIQIVEVSGHAGYAQAGEDIVCAAVSAQVISIENSLTALLDLDVQTEVNDVEGGYLKMILPTIDSTKTSQKAQLLLTHLEFALEVLEENYPDFIEINQFNL